MYESPFMSDISFYFIDTRTIGVGFTSHSFWWYFDPPGIILGPRLLIFKKYFDLLLIWHPPFILNSKVSAENFSYPYEEMKLPKIQEKLRNLMIIMTQPRSATRLSIHSLE